MADILDLLPTILLGKKTHHDDVINDAAAEITRLREALEPFAKEASTWADDVDDSWTLDDDRSCTKVTVGHCRAARAALQQEGESLD